MKYSIKLTSATRGRTILVEKRSQKIQEQNLKMCKCRQIRGLNNLNPKIQRNPKVIRQLKQPGLHYEYYSMGSGAHRSKLGLCKVQAV